jgi:hypothetical protein
LIKPLTERVDLFQFCVNNHALNGDALQVVGEINMGSKSLSRIGHFIEGIHQDGLCLRSSRFFLRLGKLTPQLIYWLRRQQS